MESCTRCGRDEIALRDDERYGTAVGYGHGLADVTESKCTLADVETMFILKA